MYLETKDTEECIQWKLSICRECICIKDTCCRNVVLSQTFKCIMEGEKNKCILNELNIERELFRQVVKRKLLISDTLATI